MWHLWVQANNEASLCSDFIQIAIRLGLRTLQNPDQQPDHSPKAVLD